ncbi:MAG: MFS transporter [Kiritimatiellia bacterium]
MKVICGKRWKGSAVLVAAYFFTQGCPILPAALTSIAADLGVSSERVGTVVSVHSAVLGAAFFFSGVLADRFSRPLLAVAGSVGTALSFLCCAAAPDYWTLLSASGDGVQMKK